MRSRLGRPSPSLVISVVALFVAMGGTSYAAIAITGKNVKDSSLTGKDIKDSSLGSSDVKDKSLRASDFSGSVKGAPGATGSTGPAGATGPKGETGPQGATGSPGLSDVERVTASVPNGLSAGHVAFAQCPTGKRVIGGGARINLNPGKAVVDESFPNSDTSWYGESASVSGNQVEHGLEVFAICAIVQNAP